MNKLTFLGTGTSYGVPVIGCKCEVCQSPHHQDKRLRSSVMIDMEGVRLIIDIGPDFRNQALTHNIDHISAILITHEHKDHIGGLDDIRAISNKMNQAIPIYGLQRTLDTIKTSFSYAFFPSNYKDLPRMNLQSIDKVDSFKVDKLNIYPIPTIHGTLPIVGYRIANFAYITDTSHIPATSLELLQGVDTLVINSLRHTPHISHFSLPESLKIINKIGATRNFLTHIAHEFGLYHKQQPLLPKNTHIATDNSVISL